MAKLTAEDVRAIRTGYAAGKWSQSDLAYIHGVSQHTIHRVVSGRVHCAATCRRTTVNSGVRAGYRAASATRVTGNMPW